MSHYYICVIGRKKCVLFLFPLSQVPIFVTFHHYISIFALFLSFFHPCHLGHDQKHLKMKLVYLANKFILLVVTKVIYHFSFEYIHYL